MNSKTFFPFLAVMTLLVAGLASASLTSGVTITFNDVELVSGTQPMASVTGETVPVRVTFTAGEDASDVRVKVRIEGFREDVSASTSRFNIVDGSTYTKLLSLEMPSDLKDTDKVITLHVSVVTSDDEVEAEYDIDLQRESYSFDLLSIDYSLQVSSGDAVPVAVVVENNAMNRMDDGFVIVSIPSLGISSKGYFGDLVTDDCSDCDIEDSIQKVVYLKIPQDAQPGVYDLVVKVYNKDASVTAVKSIAVGQSSSTMVFAATKNQDIGVGETKQFDLVIVNSADAVKVYNLQTVSGNGLVVSAPAVVTVSPASSITVPITVKAEDAAEGSYTFTVNVDGQPVTFNANVTSSRFSNSVVALTVVLAIIFVVLLIVLIVLLSRKEKPSDEVETSYY